MVACEHKIQTKAHMSLLLLQCPDFDSEQSYILQDSCKTYRKWRLLTLAAAFHEQIWGKSTQQDTATQTIENLSEPRCRRLYSQADMERGFNKKSKKKEKEKAAEHPSI